MMFIDTHIFIWLYAGLREKFSDEMAALLDSHDIRISPIVMLETQYLYEIKRITCSAKEIYEDLHLRIGVTINNDDFSLVIQNSLLLEWTRDPFDRIIAAHAMALSLPLMTADEIILKNCPAAIWR